MFERAHWRPREGLKQASVEGLIDMQMRWLSTFVLLAGAGVFSNAALAAGDPEAGKSQAVVCAACHGQDGASPIDPSYPVLAGQNEK